MVMLKYQWTEKEVSISDLKPYERNPRKISKESFENLKRSIKEDGYHQRIIANADMTVVGGHQRLKALKEIGIDKVKILLPSEQIPHEDFRRILVRDNLQAGEFDFDMLANDFDVDELIDWGMPEDWLPADVNDAPIEDLSSTISTSYKIEIECRDEMEQEEMFNRFQAEGLKCRILTL